MHGRTGCTSGKYRLSRLQLTVCKRLEQFRQIALVALPATNVAAIDGATHLPLAEGKTGALRRSRLQAARVPGQLAKLRQRLAAMNRVGDKL